MTITMHNARPINIQEMTQVLESTDALSFQAANKTEMYEWIETTLRDSHYLKLKKKHRGIVRHYLQKMTGLKKAQVTVLIKQFKKTTRVKVREYQRHSFPKRYTIDDVALVAEADLVLRKLAGPATAAIFKREYEIFGKKEYEKLSRISSSHIYNFRRLRFYRDKTKLFQKTKARNVPIGERRKPDPEGKPGYIRVDTVHQGDSATEEKGLYTINLVCELTQFEIMVATEKISEAYMIPVLEAALAQFPFVIINFHADNGGEFINYQVAELLQRMLIKLTKSRSRKTNDNALVESKNGSIVRKYLGHMYIPQKHAELVNEWYRDFLNPFVNFHRPCAFGKEVIINETTGKRKRIYPHQNYQTPYEKLKSVPNAQQHLKQKISFEQLDKIAYANSDIEFAKKVEQAREKLFSKFKS
jgi:hypothetical protein